MGAASESDSGPEDNLAVANPRAHHACAEIAQMGHVTAGRAQSGEGAGRKTAQENSKTR